MPLLDSFFVANCTLFAWHVSEDIEGLLAQCDEKLRNLFKSEISQIKSVKRQKEMLCTRLICHNCFGAELGHHPDGSPYLIAKPGEKMPNISISHSGEYVVVAAYSDEAVGVDLQLNDKRLGKLTGYYVNDEDKLNEAFPMALCELWSAKEALYKVHYVEDLMHDWIVDMPMRTARCRKDQKQATITIVPFREDYILTLAQLR